MELPFPVISLGFEPKTHSLEGCCSIQLSYETRSFASRTRWWEEGSMVRINGAKRVQR